MSDDREARIRERAYHIWVEKGRPNGREQEHWDEAERDIDQEQQAGFEMLQIDQKETIAKPKGGSVGPDHRPSQEPVMKTDELPPVHAEKEPAHTDSASAAKEAASAKDKAKPNAKRAAEKKAEAAPAPRGRKSKVKPGTMETL
jgi:hypothetical protein